MLTYKIAICDSDEVIGFQIEDYLMQISKSYNITFEIEVYFTGERLCNALKNGTHYDLIFLEVEFGKMSECLNGIQIGTKIREEYNDMITQIVYISANTKYALELFQNNPLGFLVKPLNGDCILKVIRKLLNLAAPHSNAFIYYFCRDSFKIKVNDISYLCSEGKKVIIYLNNGELVSYYGSLEKAYTEQLIRYDFLYIHRSYIVNFDYISAFQYMNVLLFNEKVLPISRLKRKEIKKRHIEIERSRRSYKKL